VTPRNSALGAGRLDDEQHLIIWREGNAEATRRASSSAVGDAALQLDRSFERRAVDLIWVGSVGAGTAG
jgi:hypothetical protein